MESSDKTSAVLTNDDVSESIVEVSSVVGVVDADKLVVVDIVVSSLDVDVNVDVDVE
jgi:hypothetical protein